MARPWHCACPHGRPCSPDLVPRDELPSAIALNSLAVNGARVLAPVIAGGLVTLGGASWVFGVNALLSIASLVVLARWRTQPAAGALPGEPMLRAMRAGLQFALMSPGLRAVMIRTFVFVANGIALLALLPILSQQLVPGSPMAYTLLLCAMGIGATAGALLMPRLRHRLGIDGLLRVLPLAQAFSMATAAWTATPWVAGLALFISGLAFMGLTSSLNMSAQLTLPNWVRARGMALFLTSVMAGNAAGAFFWGHVADALGVDNCLLLAGAAGALACLLLSRKSIGPYLQQDHTPRSTLRLHDTGVVQVQDSQGPVVVTIRYQVLPEEARNFEAVMDESRRSRLQQGALSWMLLLDTSRPGAYVEQYVDADWMQHRRRFERLTTADQLLWEKKRRFHVGEHGPVVERLVGVQRV